MFLRSFVLVLPSMLPVVCNLAAVDVIAKAQNRSHTANAGSHCGHLHIEKKKEWKILGRTREHAARTGDRPRSIGRLFLSHRFTFASRN